MRSLGTLLITSTLLASLSAQEMPQPAKELARFERMVGEWDGKGTASMEPGAPAMPWTATMSVRKSLGGFFYEEDLTVRFEGMPAPLQMKEVFGWDAERQEYVKYVVGNGGEGHAPKVHWIDDDTCVELYTGFDMSGKPSLSRGTTHFSGDGFTYKSESLTGADPLRLNVEGRFTRAEHAAKAEITEASFMDTEPSPELARLQKALGTWKVAGTMIMEPGAPEMKISGTETMKTLWGGTVVQSIVVGDPDPAMGGAVYQGLSYMTYDPAKKCIVCFQADSMGMCGVSECRFEGDDLVVTTAGPMMGKPTASRAIMHMDDKGITRVVSHALSGTAAPYKGFDATYTRAK